MAIVRGRCVIIMKVRVKGSRKGVGGGEMGSSQGDESTGETSKVQGAAEKGGGRRKCAAAPNWLGG